MYIWIHFFTANVTAEQLFNIFFNEAFPTRRGPITNPYYTQPFSRHSSSETNNENHHQQVNNTLTIYLIIICYLDKW